MTINFKAHARGTLIQVLRMNARSRKCARLKHSCGSLTTTAPMLQACRVACVVCMRHVVAVAHQEKHCAVATRCRLFLVRAFCQCPAAARHASGFSRPEHAARCGNKHLAWALAISASALKAPRKEAAIAPCSQQGDELKPHARRRTQHRARHTAKSSPAISLGCQDCMPSMSALACWRERSRTSRRQAQRRPMCNQGRPARTTRPRARLRS